MGSVGDGPVLRFVCEITLSPGIEVSRPIEASSRRHRGVIEASSRLASRLSIEAGKSYRG